jgi:hypothetical protein
MRPDSIRQILLEFEALFAFLSRRLSTVNPPFFFPIDGLLGPFFFAEVPRL